MGQRMQVVFQVEDWRGNRTNIAFYLRWGYGRITPMFIMQALIRVRQMDYLPSVVDVLKQSKTGEALLMTNETECDDEFEEKLQRYDFRDIEQARNWFLEQDNNNGGAIVYLKDIARDSHEIPENRASCRVDSITFLRGREDCRRNETPFDRFLSFDEYANIPIHKEYCEKFHFAEMFKAFMETIA